MQNDLLTREFKASDIPKIAELSIALGYPTTFSEMEERMKNMLPYPDYKTIVAVKEKKIVGYMGMLKIFFWEKNGCFIRIQALVVKKTARKSGVGKALINYAEKWGHEIGATWITLNCGNKEERTDAHKFYPKMGFQSVSTGYIKLIITTTEK